MDNSYVGNGDVGQVSSECMSDTKSRLWQITNKSGTKDELICPRPRYATKVPFTIGSRDKFGYKPRSILPLKRRDCSQEILDFVLMKDDDEGNSEASHQLGFFCGSPPLRIGNPLVNDPWFVKQTMKVASPSEISPQLKLMAKRSSPSCGTSLGSKPKIRVEGFTCGSPDSCHGVVHAVA